MKVEKIKQIILGGENVTTEFKECTDKISNSVYVYCLIREKVVTFRMVKLNMLLSIFLITK